MTTWLLFFFRAFGQESDPITLVGHWSNVAHVYAGAERIAVHGGHERVAVTGSGERQEVYG